MKNFFIIIYSALLFLGNILNASENTIEKIETELKHAETWYWMARATVNSIDYHSYSINHYKEIERLASTLPPSNEKERWLSIAKAGKDQAEWRKINAWNSFRNTYPAVWWLTGQDPTLEFKDEDHLMLALANCWNQLFPGLTALPSTPPKVFTIPRCNDSTTFEQSTDCGEIKDEFLNTLDQDPRFLGVRDDAVALALGSSWENFVSSESPLLPEQGRKLGDFLKTDKLLIVDILPIDEMSDPFDVGRIDMQYYLWDFETNTYITRGNESGTVVTIAPRRWMYSTWIFSLFLLSILLIVVRNQFFNLSEAKLKTHLILGLVAFIVGYILSYYSGQASNLFLPEFGDMTIDTEDYFPIFEMIYWPIIHGFLVMLGPLVISAFLITRFTPQIKAVMNENLDVMTTLPSMQLGVLASLFAPIILSWHTGGLELAIVLSAAVLLLIIAVSPSVEIALGQSASGANTSPYLPIVLSVIGLLLVLPAGFFQPQFPSTECDFCDVHPLVFLNGMTHWYVALLIIILSFMIWRSTPKTLSTSSTVGGETESDIEGNLRLPNWVLDNSREYSDILNDLENPDIYTYFVLGEQGIGKSRFINEIKKNFIESDWILGSAKVERPDNDIGSEQSSEPFSIVSEAFGPALGISNLAQRQATLDAASKTFSGIESSLLDFPGVGMILDMASDDSEVLTKDQLIQDVISAIKQKSKEGKLIFFLDDIQWIDESSFELIKKLILEFRQNNSSLKNPVVLIMSSREGAVSQELLANTKFINKIIEPQPFTEQKISEFLFSSGLKSMPNNFPKEVYEYLGTGNPQYILEFIKSLISEGYAKESSDGIVTLLPEFNSNSWKQIIPKGLNEQIINRLNQLSESDLLLLECAAQIGSKFSIGALSAGVNKDRLEVLNLLRKLEKDTNIIVDVDESDDHYELESQILADVLKQQTKKKLGNEHPELIKEMHYRIANYMIDNIDDFSLDQILSHCLSAGRRLGLESIKYAEEAVTYSINKFAWSEALSCIDKIENANLMTYMEDDLKNKFSYYKSQSLRGVGGQANREEARSLLMALIGNSNFNQYDIVFSWLETTYEEKQITELEELINVISVNGWDKPSSENSSDILVALLAKFYYLIANNFLAGKEFDDNEYQKNLNEVLNNLNALEDSALDMKVKSLKSMVLQELALNDTRKGKDAIPLIDKINTLFDESLALKEECNDLPGIAINLGSRGSFYLYTLNDYKNAREYLKKDLDLVLKMGDQGAKTQLLNKLAMCDWLESQDVKDDERSMQLQNSAFNLAFESYQSALFLDREMDLVFSALSIFKYGTEEDLEVIDSVGNEINNDNLWKEISSPYLKSELANCLNNLLIAKDKVWVKSLLEKVS